MLFVIIPIPIGRRYTVQATGSVTKSVCCERCHCQYHYTAQRIGVGHGMSVLWLDNNGASKRAHSKATADLERKLVRVTEAVPCPTCYWYQRNMLGILKQKEARNILLLGLLTAVIAAIALLAGASIFEWLTPLASIAIQIFLALVTFSITSSCAWLLFSDPNKHPSIISFIRHKFINLKNKLKYRNWITVTCGSCGQKIRFPNKKKMVISCPKCKYTFMSNPIKNKWDISAGDVCYFGLAIFGLVDWVEKRITQHFHIFSMSNCDKDNYSEFPLPHHPSCVSAMGGSQPNY